MILTTVKRYSLLSENLSKYWAILFINAKNSYAYLGSITIDFVVIYVRLLTLALIYKVTFESGGAVKFAPLTVAQVVWLIMFVQSLRIQRDVMNEIADTIKTGQIAVLLNKPFSYPIFQYFSYLGKIIVPTFTNIVFGGVIAYFLVGPIQFNGAALVLVLPLILGAATLIFLQSFIFGIISFWVEDPAAFSRIYHKLDMVLGGSLFPIVLFPEPLKSIALVLPWAQQFYSVGKVLVVPDFNEIGRFYLFQGLWIIFFGTLGFWLFKKGLKNIVMQGG